MCIYGFPAPFAVDELKQIRGAAGTKASLCYVRYREIVLSSWQSLLVLGCATEWLLLLAR